MTFLDKLKAHVGGLVRIKTELYWYDAPYFGSGEDPGRICLLLDAIAADGVPAFIHAEALVGPNCSGAPEPSAAVLLFIDGMSKWILVWVDVVELIDAQDNPDGSQKIF